MFFEKKHHFFLRVFAIKAIQPRCTRATGAIHLNMGLMGGCAL
jgi:hypothetical protein